jgi:hypothetical protein
MIGSLQRAIRVNSDLDDAVLQKLLDELESASRPHERLYRLLRPRRTHNRRRYRARGVTVTFTQHGEKVRLLVPPRNLSAGGIAFLCPIPVSPGITCQVTLVPRGDQADAVAGVTRHCRRVTSGWYELGVEFDQQPEPDLFAASDRNPTG